MEKNKKNFKIVGKPIVRQDGVTKVTGKAKFAADYNFPNELQSVMLRIHSSHALIKSIDFSCIENDSNVAAIIDHRDIPGDKKVGVIKKDQPIFCSEKVVTPGDVIAMIVGKSERELIKIKDKIKIEYEDLPVLTDPSKSLETDAPLIHPEYKSNLIVHYPLRKGNVDSGFSNSEHILEQTYTTQNIEHAYIEPECVTAIPQIDNSIKIIGSIQNPHTTRRIVAAVLGISLSQVVIIQADLGGSFGGKDDTMNILSARAAVAAIKTGRPVKIKYSREDSILESYKRHPYVMHYKVGYNSSGKITTMKIDVTADGGAYASMSPFVTWRTVVQATGPYEIENVWTDVKAVYTNNPYTGAMRGFGSPQPIFAQESIMDEIAERLGMNPVEIREINALKQNSVTSTGQRLENHEVTLTKAMKTAIEKTGFVDKWNNYRNQSLDKSNFILSGEDLILSEDKFISRQDKLRRGIGLSISLRGCSLGAEGIDAAAALVAVQPDGSVYLLSGLAENGQGLRTTYSIVAAEILGIATDKIIYLEQDTSRIPDSGPTVASRATLMGGGAFRNASEIIQKRITNLLLNEWQLDKEAELIFEDSMIKHIASNKSIEFTEACSFASQRGINLSVVGWYKGPDVSWDEEIGQGSAYFTYVYGCHVAEVSVNINTGEIYINKITAVHDAGKIINILGAQGQVYGGSTQGAGYAVWEEIDKHNGFIREMNFDQYLIPTSKDIKSIDAIFIEGEDDYGAWGAKSLGEPTLELTAGAIANAVKNATGKRYFNLPLNLEEILLNRKLRPEDMKRGSE
ncbi:MAG: xanthine dehydrogenase family protein molybdopterin-binding subunit [Melioribacteraceae bacterium]|nr:xanthine dehydrogenase family protein molybdopterin-binding subunit [Melioribacteraceae bacterium]MCF8353717.1 xanthine dehydrogenase family protein molybdopterin-binding subunit [Melioribacteraceae bacterium]MCF8394970.1 xanthine dehydrogenase family protein molybdopterin-binding subunit [Melioribacteraceae bacterium]MCF8418633.1 xanthine dehydrogenase family protein molybdopterin-binding subunit [Melioribacteraceae bacterium]